MRVDKHGLSRVRHYPKDMLARCRLLISHLRQVGSLPSSSLFIGIDWGLNSQFIEPSEVLNVKRWKLIVISPFPSSSGLSYEMRGESACRQQRNFFPPRLTHQTSINRNFFAIKLGLNSTNISREVIWISSINPKSCHYSHVSQHVNGKLQPRMARKKEGGGMSLNKKAKKIPAPKLQNANGRFRRGSEGKNYFFQLIKINTRCPTLTQMFAEALNVWFRDMTFLFTLLDYRFRWD